ncbi:MAG: F0F1 ATP synthase subunit A [Clostridia bacterium]|nr:F0F1 ATP synthase subunit A [Clostridia bacterium]
MGEKSEVVIPLGGILDVTGEVIAMWAILALVLVLSLIATHNMKELPGTFQNMVEAGIEYLDNFFSGIIGKHHTRKYFYFLGSLFIFIIVANYTGLIPGVGLTKYFKAPTASLSVTLGLGVCTFLFLQIAGLRVGAKHYFKRFISPIAFMLPLMVLDEFIKPASLALRLFGNVFGEETVTHNLYDLLPIGAPVLMMALSILFCAIQAVVFTMLTSIYLEEAIEVED